VNEETARKVAEFRSITKDNAILQLEIDAINGFSAVLALLPVRKARVPERVVELQTGVGSLLTTHGAALADLVARLVGLLEIEFDDDMTAKCREAIAALGLATAALQSA
jgi:hypothetical protein